MVKRLRATGRIGFLFLSEVSVPLQGEEGTFFSALIKREGVIRKITEKKTKHALLKDFDTSFDINFDLYK